MGLTRVSALEGRIGLTAVLFWEEEVVAFAIGFGANDIQVGGDVDMFGTVYAFLYHLHFYI